MSSNFAVFDGFFHATTVEIYCDSPCNRYQRKQLDRIDRLHRSDHQIEGMSSSMRSKILFLSDRTQTAASDSVSTTPWPTDTVEQRWMRLCSCEVPFTHTHSQSARPSSQQQNVRRKKTTESLECVKGVISNCNDLVVLWCAVWSSQKPLLQHCTTM
jgi:hypothetical protein